VSKIVCGREPAHDDKLPPKIVRTERIGELAECLVTCLTQKEDLIDGGVNGGESDGLADLGVELAENIAFRAIVAYFRGSARRIDIRDGKTYQYTRQVQVGLDQ
jgi:hypothetical protein